MSRRPNKSKPVKLRISRSKWRFILPLLVILLISGIGLSLNLFSHAARGDGGDTLPVGTYIAPNPPVVSVGCKTGLNIALVADVSGSVWGKSDERTQMLAAFNDFISTLLPSTNSKISFSYFADSAKVAVTFANSTATTLQQAINYNTINSNIRSVGNGTNWYAGLVAGYSTFTPSMLTQTNNVLIIATDGDPNQSNGPTGNSILDPVNEANIIKTAGAGGGVHILAVGLGSDPTKANLQAISGDVYTGDINSDVIISAFASLDDSLINIAQGTCVGTGTGTTGTGTGTTGTGTGVTGTGTGVTGTGTGVTGTGTGVTGTGTGTSAGPSAPAGTTPSPIPTPTPSPKKSPAPAAQPSNKPNPAPKPTAQGVAINPPKPPPSPFHDGKDYAPGSAPDNSANAVIHRVSHGWWYGGLIAMVAILASGGYLVWHQQHKPATKAATKKKTKRPKK